MRNRLIIYHLYKVVQRGDKSNAFHKSAKKIMDHINIYISTKIVYLQGVRRNENIAER